MRFRVSINRKDGLADPEGAATKRALNDLGYADVSDVHFGRIIHVDIDSADGDAARREVEEMCERLLANPVIEDYAIEVVG